MSLVRLVSEDKDDYPQPDEPFHAVRADSGWWSVDAKRNGEYDWVFDADEVERVPAHRGQYWPHHFGEFHFDVWNSESVYYAKHRKPGEAT